MNPSQSPASPTEAPKFSRRIVGALPAVVVGAALMIASVYQFHLAAQLKLDYPGLTDPSPDVDAYWPSLAHYIYSAVGWVLAVASFVSGAVGGSLIYRRGRGDQE